MTLLPVEDALARLLGDAMKIADVESIPLSEAAGRVLAEDVVATRDQPPFTASAMDGYAVRAADTAAGGAVLDVIAESAAGHGFSGRLGRGDAVRIFTGTPLPDGADSILIQENARLVEGNGKRIEVLEPVEPGRFVRPAGLDFAAGDRLLSRGDLLDPGRVTLAAASNRAHLAVLRRPRVAILATGDELVSPGIEPAAEQIVASNTFGVSSIAAENGAQTHDLGIARDSLDSIDGKIAKAMDWPADILVTLGGASVGDHDLVRAALAARGMELDFWKIAMRPGKPLMFGRMGAMRVLGLPGNPVSSLVCTHIFLKPLLRRLAGLPETTRMETARLATALPANDNRQDYLRVRLSRDEDGNLLAHPFDRQDSSMMRVFAIADALLIRAPGAAPAAPGSQHSIMLLRSPPA